MKKVSDYLAEELEYDDAIENAKKAAAKYAPQLKAMFPNFQYVDIEVIKMVGMVLTVDIWSPYKVTRHNADMNGSFMMQFEDAGGQKIASSKFTLEKNGLHQKLKYRKIAGKTPEEVIKKFMIWVKKNEALIKEIGGVG